VPENPDVVIIGAGVAGAAMATVLARGGISVLLLERSIVHQDRVRGEYVAPWGVIEAHMLGVLDVLVAAGGHYVPLSLPYGDSMPPLLARSRFLDVRSVVPEVAGALTISHPRMCQALGDAAQVAGATFVRGAKNVQVITGQPPKVSYVVDQQKHELTPRLVIGADGRGSTIARQIRATVETNPEHHLLAGLLVTGVDVWPEQEYSIGTDGDVLFFVLPQGNGRIRLYLGYGLDQARRFTGSDNSQRFLDAFRLPSLPFSDVLSTARPAGPCRGYPNADAWIDRPVAPGVVLIGDAAGHNDPTIGQGLSIAFRDVRLVADALDGASHWTAKSFEPYLEERRERMRRLRFTAQHYSILFAEFGEAARARRARAMKRMAIDKSKALPLLPLLKGPFNVPHDAFEPAAWDRLMN